MKISLVLVATLTVAACAPGQAFDPTPNDSYARQVARQGNPEDVRFCDYEVSKTTAIHNSQNNLGAAIQETERKASVFNACMRYRQGR